MGQEIKEKMRQSLMKITPYQTHQTYTDGSLGQSLKPKGSKAAANDKPRKSVDADSELRNALDGMRSSYKSTANLRLQLPAGGNVSP